MTDHLQEAIDRFEMATKEQSAVVSDRNCNRALAAAAIAIAEDMRQMRIALWGVYGVLYPDATKSCWCDGTGDPGPHHAVHCPQLQFS